MNSKYENNNILHLSLNWDGTTSCYSPEFGILAQQAVHISIITLNDEITVAHAVQTLGVDDAVVKVYICPDERINDYGIWKAETCLAQGVSLMIDN